jgi:hypothetical protein
MSLDSAFCGRSAENHSPTGPVRIIQYPVACLSGPDVYVSDVDNQTSGDFQRPPVST